jgi:hypothetical protein
MPSFLAIPPCAHLIRRHGAFRDHDKFFVFGHVVLGDRELENESLIEVERDAKRFLFRPQTGFGASTTPTWFIILNDDRSVATIG